MGPRRVRRHTAACARALGSNRRYPDADAKVYVGWMPMMAPDANPQVADLLVDARARHSESGGLEHALRGYLGTGSA